MKCPKCSNSKLQVFIKKWAKTDDTTGKPYLDMKFWMKCNSCEEELGEIEKVQGGYVMPDGAFTKNISITF